MSSFFRYKFVLSACALLACVSCIYSKGVSAPLKASSNQRLAESNKSKAKSSESETRPGWLIKVVNERFGLTKYLLSDTTMKAESPMLIVFADASNNLITVGTWETKKSFTFPLDKAKYYTQLMGISNAGSGSGFRRDYKQSPWAKTRTLKVGDLSVTEYIRHVTNPPPGRTRTQYQQVSSAGVLPVKLLAVYNQLIDSNPADSHGIVLQDKTVITNPPQGWTDVETRMAQKTILTREELRFPEGFQRVGSVSELFLAEDQANNMDEKERRLYLEKKLKSRSESTTPRGSIAP